MCDFEICTSFDFVANLRSKFCSFFWPIPIFDKPQSVLDRSKESPLSDFMDLKSCTELGWLRSDGLSNGRYISNDFELFLPNFILLGRADFGSFTSALWKGSLLKWLNSLELACRTCIYCFFSGVSQWSENLMFLELILWWNVPPNVMFELAPKLSICLSRDNCC